MAWKNFYRVWMNFINDFKNAGGRVTTGSDAGFIYELYGFGLIQEFEMLQEAGFHPLEVLRSATLSGAEALFEPKGRPIEYGIVRAGSSPTRDRRPEPAAESQSALRTGAMRLNAAGKSERVGGVKYTIKDGIVYDAKQLLADVARDGRQAEARATDHTVTAVTPAGARHAPPKHRRGPPLPWTHSRAIFDTPSERCCGCAAWPSSRS